MKALNSTKIRKTAICIATAIVIAAPGMGTAGVFDTVKNRAQTLKAKTVKKVNQVRNQQPLAGAFEEMGGNTLITQVRDMNIIEQLNTTISLMEQMQADYQYFSGGEGCGAECATFRMELKGVFNDFLALIDEVPVLGAGTGLVEQLERVSNLVDYVPPRALYLMWQALAGKMQELVSAADQIRQALASLPPLDPVADIQVFANNKAAFVDNSRMCDWARQDDMPLIELIQAKLEMLAWSLKTAEGLIPDVEVEAEGGAEVGIGVGMVTGSAAITVKPTDQVKIALKAVAVLPERINWAIKINVLRAKTVCKAADLASN